ncbi:helix-turn-helix domain-containing protein [Streptomyces sp. NPDC051561]|uniref:helix-turn-helix domain-containing protein n=1 Tax=Streptomyces sp. NPDC051561 TaxID=3365658 RepID=UPI0037A48353
MSTEPTEPTVAELRADLAERLASARPGLSASVLRGVLDLLDEWQQEAADGALRRNVQHRTEAETARDRLRAAGRARREWENRYAPWKAEIIYNAHHVAGASVPDIAEEFGCSEGYVYRVLRTNAAYEYRLDVRDGAPGPGWQPFESADVVAPINEPEVIAHRAIEEYLAAHPEHADHEVAEPRLRVLIWTAAAKEQPDEQAVRTVLWPYPDDDEDQ